MKFILILILFFISKFALCEIVNINNIKLKKLLKNNIPIIDIRTEKEWIKYGIIENAKTLSILDEKGKLSLTNWFNRFSKFTKKNRSIIIICASGGRSNFISSLINKKFKNLKIYHPYQGMNEWTKSKNKVIKYSK